MSEPTRRDLDLTAAILDAGYFMGDLLVYANDRVRRATNQDERSLIWGLNVDPPKVPDDLTVETLICAPRAASWDEKLKN